MSDKIRDIHRTYQLLRRLVKYGITMLTVLCAVHSGLLTVGHDLLGIHLLLCSFLYVLGICLSQLFGLCWVHKACVLYICTTVLFIVLNRHSMFPVMNVDIRAARGVMYFVGLYIAILVLWKIRDKNC